MNGPQVGTATWTLVTGRALVEDARHAPRLQEAHTRAGRGGWEGAEELAGGWRCCPLSWWQVLGSAQSAKRRQVYIVVRLLLYVYVCL